MLLLQDHPQGISFKVFIQPRSSKNEITGLYRNALKMKVKAPPVEGAANKMCLKLLAKYLNVPKSSLEIVSGHTSRTKQILCRLKNHKFTEKERNKLIHRIELLLNFKQTT